MQKPGLFLISLGALLFILTSCENKSKTDVKSILPHYELTADKDTVNYLDVNGLKQGHWIIYEKGVADVNTTITYSADSLTNQHVVNFGGVTKIEEGFYKNDKKIGYWKSFSKDGSLKDSTEHKMNS